MPQLGLPQGELVDGDRPPQVRAAHAEIGAGAQQSEGQVLGAIATEQLEISRTTDPGSSGKMVV